MKGFRGAAVTTLCFQVGVYVQQNNASSNVFPKGCCAAFQKRAAWDRSDSRPVHPSVKELGPRPAEGRIKEEGGGGYGRQTARRA